MIENYDSHITFEIPTNVDFDKLIKLSNYTLYWKNLQHGSSTNDSINGSDYVDLPSHHYPDHHGVPTMGYLDNTGYARIISEVWIGIVLTLIILSTIFCLYSSFLYCRFRYWQKRVQPTAAQTAIPAFDVEAPPIYQLEGLPSYTLVTGLPTYDDAMKQTAAPKGQNYNFTIYRPSIFGLFESHQSRMLKTKIELSSSGLKSIPHECRISVVMPPISQDFDYYPSICEKNRIEEVEETVIEEIATISGCLSRVEITNESEKEKNHCNQT